MSDPNAREPSVLDYLKAKLTPWRGPAPVIPTPEAKEKTPSKPLPAERGEEISPEQPVYAWEGFSPFAMPWVGVFALALALLAQRFFEQFDPSATTGIVLYLIAIAFTLWAFWRGEWRLAPLPYSEPQTDPLTVRRVALVSGVLLSLVAFLAMGGNRFTSLNVFLWLLGLGYLLYAFWLPDPEKPPLWARLREALRQPAWGIKISYWAVLVALAFGLAAFFRFYQLEAVPPEMVSDHAEKLLDVYDVLNGQTSIFFPRNTGREPLQMYLTAAMANLFNTGLSFLSLKLGTALLGLASLIYVYLLGVEIGDRKVGLLALVLAGIAYWPNVQARVALRFILYPAFVAPTLYYLLRGLRTGNRNHFLLAGLALGIGLHGYSPIRVLPILVLVALGLYLLHQHSKGMRRQTILLVGLLALIALIVFLPLLRYMLEDPQMFFYRGLTRVGTTEQELPGPAWQIFLSNLWDALKMVNWSGGNIWVIGLTNRPALDLVSASLFLLGVVLLVLRYLRRRHWLDLFLLISVPFLMLPSILSLAFPAENPALNRAGGATVPIFLICALALDGLLRGIREKISGRWGQVLAWGLGLTLVAFSAGINYDLVFNQYYQQYRNSAWNTSEMGAVIEQFAETVGDRDSAWVVAYPYWVDTRLVGMNAGFPTKDYAIWPDELDQTLDVPAPKLFLVKPEDQEGLDALQVTYPQGLLSLHDSAVDFKDFYIYFVPSGDSN